MTPEEIRKMETQALEARRAQIATEAEAEGADTEALLAEVRAINEELEKRAAKAQAQADLRAAVAQGAGQVVNQPTPAPIDIRSSEEYLNAYAKFLVTGNDAEVRAMLSENGSGQIAVPTYVAERMKTAWESNKLAAKIGKLTMPGNYKQGFELSAGGATKHTEGSSDVSEEALENGIVSLIPAYVIKWKAVSKEAISIGMGGRAVIDYLFDELDQKIVKAIIDDLLDKIVACSSTGTTTMVAVGEVTATQLSVGLVAEALGELSDAADNPCIVTNKKTWAALKAAQSANKYNYDPFEGLEVIFNNHLPAFSAASTGDTFMIVGDFGEGALANYPNGEAVEFIFDNITLATSGMVKVTGSEYVAIEPVAMNAFVKVKK
jgi:HK97 family phage major capsid protein